MWAPLDRLLRPLTVIAWLHAVRQALALLLLPVLLLLLARLFCDLAALARGMGW